MLANKWTALAVGEMESGPKRFGELRRKLEGISQKMLTQTLRTLERDGLVARTVYPTVPLRVEYALTDLGRSVTEPLRALRTWSVANIRSIEAARTDYDENATREPSPV
ncbi:winged helix-turn-helix transcriptional regulator [Umezawaea beigongshangensis]|uniref:winged helix-turn-helix transcriptional regulator n=1 Tax=Umezawaea beigongshangensis TaxID=2780383 RepID=UPI0018F17835|nr:helix-turn-helix domain-containing protein [Umezawaea beigongshangensis]